MNLTSDPHPTYVQHNFNVAKYHTTSSVLYHQYSHMHPVIISALCIHSAINLHWCNSITLLWYCTQLYQSKEII